MSLDKKVAIVTGATSGVGRGTALVLAERGARVVATGRRGELGTSLESEARARGGIVTFVRADVRNTDDCNRVVERVVSEHGSVDILVNNAGIEGTVADLHALTDQDWFDVIDTNLNGAVRFTRAVLPHMVERGGGVVLSVSSISAAPGMTLAHVAPYCASKAALEKFTMSVAVEYMLHGVRANVITLGGAEGDTARRTQEAMAKLVLGPGADREGPSAMEAAVTQSAEDVGRTIAHLCHDDAELITGVTIALDRAVSAGFLTSTTVHMLSAGLWS